MKRLYWYIIMMAGLVLLASYIFTSKTDDMSKAFFLAGEILFGPMMLYIYHHFAELYEVDMRKKRLEKENKYDKSIHCTNCEFKNVFEIEKGVCMAEFLTNKKCKRCGCILRD